METHIDKLFSRHKPNIRQHFAIVMSADGRKMIAWGASRLANEGFDHAEENAIRELASKRLCCKLHRHLSNLTIVVARKHNDQLKQSKPCAHCCKAIRDAGIFKWVMYSTENGFTRERVRDLKSDYISIGRMRRALEETEGARHLQAGS